MLFGVILFAYFTFSTFPKEIEKSMQKGSQKLGLLGTKAGRGCLRVDWSTHFCRFGRFRKNVDFSMFALLWNCVSLKRFEGFCPSKKFGRVRAQLLAGVSFRGEPRRNVFFSGQWRRSLFQHMWNRLSQFHNMWKTLNSISENSRTPLSSSVSPS